MRAVAEEILELVVRYGGVNSSEHGDGLVRSEFNQRIFGAELYEAMREVKALFDPDGRLNPGKIVDAPPMTENLRDVALPQAGPLRTHLQFADGGMRDAADRCMNIGACRKTDAGVMCPSYMATREEEHSTRGRANALVKALSTPDPRVALGDERLHEIMDLCLECKACKSECPLSVDMASLKSEFLAHYQEIHGTPLRSRVFASGTAAQPNRRGDRPALQPPRAGSAPAPRARRPPGDRRAAAPAAVRTRDVDPVVRPPRSGARRRSPWGGRLSRRFVHDLHRAGDRAGLRGAARARRLARAPGEQGLLRARQPLQGAA